MVKHDLNLNPSPDLNLALTLTLTLTLALAPTLPYPRHGTHENMSTVPQEPLLAIGYHTPGLTLTLT